MRKSDMKDVIEVDIQLDKKTLNRFLIRNNYLRSSGIIGLLLSIAAIAALVLFWEKLVIAQIALLAFLGLMFTVIQPVSLLMKGWNQLKTGAFREPFHYVFSKEKMVVTNVAGTVEVEWNQVRKVVVTKEALYIYMNAVSAFIVSRRECEDNFSQIAKLCKECTE